MVGMVVTVPLEVGARVADVEGAVSEPIVVVAADDVEVAKVIVATDVVAEETDVV